jgi:hypothetical protein
LEKNQIANMPRTVLTLKKRPLPRKSHKEKGVTYHNRKKSKVVHFKSQVKRSSGVARVMNSLSYDTKIVSRSFNVGDVVKAKYKATELGPAGTSYYPGKITSFRNGLYGIRYEDGDVERGVNPMFIRQL